MLNNNYIAERILLPLNANSQLICDFQNRYAEYENTHYKIITKPKQCIPTVTTFNNTIEINFNNHMKVYFKKYIYYNLLGIINNNFNIDDINNYNTFNTTELINYKYVYTDSSIIIKQEIPIIQQYINYLNFFNNFIKDIMSIDINNNKNIIDDIEKIIKCDNPHTIYHNQYDTKVKFVSLFSLDIDNLSKHIHINNCINNINNNKNKYDIFMENIFNYFDNQININKKDINDISIINNNILNEFKHNIHLFKINKNKTLLVNKIDNNLNVINNCVVHIKNIINVVINYYITKIKNKIYCIKIKNNFDKLINLYNDCIKYNNTLNYVCEILQLYYGLTVLYYKYNKYNCIKSFIIDSYIFDYEKLKLINAFKFTRGTFYGLKNIIKLHNLIPITSYLNKNNEYFINNLYIIGINPSNNNKNKYILMGFCSDMSSLPLNVNVDIYNSRYEELIYSYLFKNII